jgi:hypothetical protein
MCRYETLLSNPESVMRQILNALELPWDDAVLNFYNSNRTVHTHSQSRKFPVVIILMLACVVVSVVFLGVV